MGDEPHGECRGELPGDIFLCANGVFRCNAVTEMDRHCRVVVVVVGKGGLGNISWGHVIYLRRVRRCVESGHVNNVVGSCHVISVCKILKISSLVG